MSVVPPTAIGLSVGSAKIRDLAVCCGETTKQPSSTPRRAMQRWCAALLQSLDGTTMAKMERKFHQLNKDPYGLVVDAWKLCAEARQE